MSNQKICLIGLGYVGLPLAVTFAEKFQVIGFDINPFRIQELKGGCDRTHEIDDGLLASVKENISYTSDIQDAADCNIYIVTVPTPIDENNSPDLSPLRKSSEMLSNILKKGDIVIYESTVYPGATEEVCIPILERGSNLKYNKDFFAGYSPERINPGDRENTLTKIKKIIRGGGKAIQKYQKKW